MQIAQCCQHNAISINRKSRQANANGDSKLFSKVQLRVEFI